MAERNGAERAFILQDSSPYGRGLGAAFEVAAERLGLEIVGTAGWDPTAEHYPALARRVRGARADTVFIAGLADNGPRLIAELSRGLGPAIQLMAGDAFNMPGAIVEEAGTGAEGLVISIAVFPNRELPPAGRRFAAEFTKRFSQRPCCFSVHDAQAAMLLLDAIERSGGDRGHVAEAVMAAEVHDGLVGDFAIDENGDSTLKQMGMYRIRDGRLRFETVITPAPELLASG